MRKLKYLARGLVVLCPTVCLAGDIQLAWTSGCATITSVNNYLAYSKEFFVTLSSGVPATCNGEILGTKGAIPFLVGKGQLTDTNVSAVLETALSAYNSGHQVMVAFDRSSQACYGMVIAVGGTSGQCH
jgi:hypothetical protein